MSSSTGGEIRGLMAHEKAPRPPPSFTLGNYKINWISTAILCVPPLLVFGAIFAGVPLVFNTAIVALIAYLFNGFGITAGYHRLFAHRAYNAHPILQWIVAFAGGGAFQGSIKWWGRNHRIHHRYIDTDKDPYNATRGFVYTHIGWMIMAQDYEILGNVDISDLNNNKIVRFQHRHYLAVALLGGVIWPTLVCGLGWGDWLGGYFYAALAKMVFTHHTTFFINSLAHSSFFGAKQNFSDHHSSHDSAFCAVLTLGEGYHNFHHEFAQDYRNGIKWYHYDPTKWLIRFFEIIGMARNLVRVPNDVIARNIHALKAKKHEEALRALQQKLREGDVKLAVTNSWSWTDIEKRIADGAKLLVVGDYVLDLQKAVPIGSGYTHANKSLLWYDAHPGGRKALDMFVGKDATEAMTGGIYAHSEGAFNLVAHLRVAQLKK